MPPDIKRTDCIDDHLLFTR